MEINVHVIGHWVLILWNANMCILHLKMVSDEANNDEDTILPDLPDEVSGEQLMMQQRVFRANENFIKKHNDIDIKWLNLPAECRVYPTHAWNNKTYYKKIASNYMYDRKRGILYKKIRNVDGIGE